MVLRRRNHQILAVLLILSLIGVYQLSAYDDDEIYLQFKSAYHKGSKSIEKLLKNRVTTNQLIFPHNYPHENPDISEQINNSTFKLEKYKHVTTFKYDTISSGLSNGIQNDDYESHRIDLYNDMNEINLKLAHCDKLKNSFSIGISKPISVDVSLEELLKLFLEQYESNPYYLEMSPFFINELKLQIEYGVVDHYWYRLAGSSVWLEQYQAHFMISRVLYSPSGLRNQPVISLTFGQLFDKDWHELVNTKILVPTNNLEGHGELTNDGVNYKVIEFPYFLPIPFWHDYDDAAQRFFGPEDPRMILIKNPQGYDEPLIVFNAYHRKFSHHDDDNDENILLWADFYRSMFVCWPWQFQKGKANTDGFPNAEYDNKLYNKVVELKLKNLPRQKTQKNWTPLTSLSLKGDNDGHKYDKYIYFIYRLANLEILKCDLTYDTGICAFTYRLNDRLSTSAPVGPLRGGTQLININQLLGDKVNKYIPNNREIWVGFARAHIDNCGCGDDMYRPNLIVLSKDLITETIEGKEHTKSIFKFSHISSSISFDIPIVGWDLMNPQNVCEGPNVLLPNGIGSWDIEYLDNNLFNDYLMLSLSISDFTVHRIYLKGLLNELINLNNRHIFDEQINPKELIGFNNDNIVCALKQSADFCYDYGINHSPSNNYNEELNSTDLLIGSKNISNKDEEQFNVDQFTLFQKEKNEVDQYKKALYHQQIQYHYQEQYKKKYGVENVPDNAVKSELVPRDEDTKSSIETRATVSTESTPTGSG